MTVGFVLLTCESGFERKVLKKLLSIKEVVEANQLSGMYDIIIRLESDSSEKLRELIVWKIRKIEKIRSVMSLIERNPLNSLIN